MPVPCQPVPGPPLPARPQHQRHVIRHFDLGIVNKYPFGTCRRCHARYCFRPIRCVSSSAATGHIAPGLPDHRNGNSHRIECGSQWPVFDRDLINVRTDRYDYSGASWHPAAFRWTDSRKLQPGRDYFPFCRRLSCPERHGRLFAIKDSSCRIDWRHQPQNDTTGTLENGTLLR